MEVYGRIYLITNNVNGKMYVGQTTRTLKRRWQGHIWSCTKKNPRMAITHAINKYGEDDFTITELKLCYSKRELDECETELIKEYQTLSPNGYNLNEGVGGNGKLSDETKQKIGDANRGKTFTEEHRKKLSDSHMGQQISDKEKQRRSDYMSTDIGLKQLDDARKKSIQSCSKIYILFDPDGNEITITNMSQFCRDNNLSKSKMSWVVNGKRKHHKGYRLG